MKHSFQQHLLSIATLILVLDATVANSILPPSRTGNFYVGNFSGDNINVYNPSGEYMRSFSAEGLDGPRGIVWGPAGKIYIASQNTDEVFVFDKYEQFITTFADTQLDAPTGMAVSNTGLLYVSSFNNDQVVVFDLDGMMQHTFTGGGMDGPNCVAFDSAGNIYVSSALTANVTKFDASENFITTFTGGGLSSPMGVARDTSEVLYVAGGGSDNIVKFDTSGIFLGTITHPDLTGPQGVAFDERGHLFSSSFFQNKIVEFDADGNYIQTITRGDLQFPRSIAFTCEGSTNCTEGIDCDNDCDGVYNQNDNCPSAYNPNQEDTYPPQSNGIGDACDCEGNFDCDQDVDADDVTAFLADFGREQYFNPCENGNPCNGDFECDGDVDADDVTKFLEDFGREQYFNPCPTCVAGDWCVYSSSTTTTLCNDCPKLADQAVGTLELVTPSAVEQAKLANIDGLAFDSFGNLFGVLEILGESGGVVYIDKDTGVVTPLILGISRSDQIALHPSGDFFVTSEISPSSMTDRIYRVMVGYDASVIPVAGTTTADAIITSLSIDNPEGLVILENNGPYGNIGDLYVAEDRNPGSIFRVVPSDGTTTFLVNGLARPEGMALGDFAGAHETALYVAETSNNNVLHIDANGVVSVWGDRTAVNLTRPDNLEFGSDGFLYVSEDRSAPASRIIQIDADGNHSVFATGFGQAQGMAFDPVNGDFYIAEQDFSRIWRVRFFTP